MGVALLDLNDCNLQLWHGREHVQSPGYALHRDRKYQYGAQARAAARLHPRDINTRYWWQLSTEKLQPALGQARHTADLAHGHLLQIHREAGQPAEAILAVPGSMQREQLSLLLGIVQQCPFDAVGLVNRSVALASLYGQHERLFHLEIQLHQAVISELSCSNNQVEAQRTVPLPGCGMLQLQERLVETIATAFVRQTRFDPRRKAATEQQLYDSLPAALTALRESAETNIEINGYRARVAAADLEDAGQRLFDSARDSIGMARPGDQLVADPLAALLPGVSKALPGLHISGADDLRRALEQHGGTVLQREQALSFVTSLPCLREDILPTGNTAPPPRAPVPTVADSAPTHLLRNGLARPLNGARTGLAGGWELYREHKGWALRGAGDAPRVNEAGYRPGQLLAAGDTVTAGGETVMLIEVEA